MDDEIAIDVSGILLDLLDETNQEYKEKIKDFILRLDERKKSLEL